MAELVDALVLGSSFYGFKSHHHLVIFMFYTIVILIFIFKFINFRRLSNLAKFFFNTSSIFFDYSFSSIYQISKSRAIIRSEIGFFSFNDKCINFYVYDNFYFYSYFNFFIFFSYHGVILLSKKKFYVFNNSKVNLPLPTIDLAFNFDNKLFVFILF